MLNTLKSLLAIIFCLSINIAYSQYDSPGLGIPLNVGAGETINTFLFGSGNFDYTVLPSASCPVLSWDNPGQIDILNGYAFLSSTLAYQALNNSQPDANIVIGNTFDADFTLTTGNALYTGRKHIGKIYVGQQGCLTCPIYANARIEAATDTLVIDEVWVPEGAYLNIGGPYPVIIRREFHNKGTVFVDPEADLIFAADTADRSSAMLEQRGEWIGRYSYEVVTNRLGESYNWDWLQNGSPFGSDNVYDSLSIAGWTNEEAQYYIDSIYTPNWLEATGQDWTATLWGEGTIGGIQYNNQGTPVMGARLAPQFRNYRSRRFLNAGPRLVQNYYGWTNPFAKGNPENNLSIKEGLWSGPEYTIDAFEEAGFTVRVYLNYAELQDWNVQFNGGSYDSPIAIWANQAYVDSALKTQERLMLDCLPEGADSISYQEIWNALYSDWNWLIIKPNWIEGAGSFGAYDITESYDYPITYIYQDSITYQSSSTIRIGGGDTCNYGFGYYNWTNYDSIVDPGPVTTVDINLLDIFEATGGQDFYYSWYPEGYTSSTALEGWAEANETSFGWKSVDDVIADGPFGGMNANTWYYESHPDNVSSTLGMTAYSDIRIAGSNAQKMWAHPNYQLWADTIMRDVHTPWLNQLGLEQYLDSLEVGYDFGVYTGDDQSTIYLAQYGLENDIFDGFETFFPETYRVPRVNTSGIRKYRITGSLDGQVPITEPLGFITYNSSIGREEQIYRWEGYPWMNKEIAYNHPIMSNYPIHANQEPIPIENQNPNQELSTIHYLPSAPDWIYYYSPTGNLYHYDSFAFCLSENDSLYCINDFETNNYYYSTNNVGSVNFAEMFDGFWYEYQENPDDFIVPEVWSANDARANKTIEVPNTLNGYLDLDLVAERYFELNPESDHIEFSRLHRSRCTGYGVYNFAAAAAGNCYSTAWKRKYHRYGDDIVSDEMQYWLTLLADQYLAANGAGFDQLTQETVIAFLNSGGNVDINSPAFNWLMEAPINPNRYVQLGRYLIPGATLEVKTNSGDIGVLEITPDMGVYDYDFPQDTNQNIFSGMFDGGPFGSTWINRGSANQSETEEYLPTATTILAMEFINDSSYFPFVFLNHRFEDDASNGSANLFEDDQAAYGSYPYVYTDSSNFRASNFVKEYGPHNQQPLWFHINQPPLSGTAWIFIPTQFQQTGSQWYDPAAGQVYTRAAMEFYDSDGQVEVIRYLDVGDTLWVRHEDDVNWPLEGKLYFTDLFGDVDGNGIITASDFILLLTAVNMCEDDNIPYFSYFDVNGDGCVTVQDFLVILNNFGQNIGNEDGEFSGYINGSAERSGPGGVDVNSAEILEFYNLLRPITDVANEVTAGGVITLWGEKIKVYDTKLNLVAQGVSECQMPLTGGPYWVAGTRSMGKWDNADDNAPDNVTINTDNPDVDDADGASIYLAPSKATVSGNATQWWIDFYTDAKTFDGNGDPSNPLPPTINQLYYGINSGSNANAANLNNAKIGGLIDIFSAGSGVSNMNNYSIGGVYNDNSFNSTAAGYRTLKAPNKQIFEPVFVPNAFVGEKVETRFYNGILGRETQSRVVQKYENGVSNLFGEFSELSGTREPGVVEWGGDIKTWNDSKVESGILSMVDFMSLEDYFKLKMHGVSTKFGLTAQASTNPRTTEESFGTVYETGAVEGIPHAPGVGFAPSKCTSLNSWTTNIIAPFFAVNMNQPVTLPTDATPSQSDGTVRNIDDANHYQYFDNAPAKIIANSYGPLCYDFDMNGVWEQADLDIWNGLVAYWTSSESMPVEGNVFESYNYYRPATDAINEVVNVISNYEDGGSYAASFTLHDWYDIDATENPLSRAVNNWYKCLHQPKWNLNQTGGVIEGPSSFDVIQDDSFFTDINLQTPTTLNNYGRVAVLDYANDVNGYQIVPSSNYFPVSKYWTP